MLEIENLLDLLQLSHEFKIDKLRKLCEDAIEPSMNIENSSVILRRAHEIGLQADELKTTCMNYILMNYQQVISTGSFYDLPKTLIKEINMIVAQYGVKVMINSRSDNNH
jgi:hypothetical protein